jgi:importin-9
LIFRQCIETLSMVKDNHPQSVRSAVGEIVPRWLEGMARVLSELDLGKNDGVEEIMGGVFKV